MYLLVTGGAGFIGSNVIQQIIDRPEIEKLVNVDCLTYAGHLENLRSVENDPKYLFEKIDLRDKSALLGVFERHPFTHVLHLAAESHVDRSITAPADFIQTNIVGTFNLLEVCRHVWGSSLFDKRFVHVSTDEVYGSLGPTGHFSETSAYAPNSPYSASKAASDMLARAYHQTYELPVIITHSSNDYGPFQYPEKLVPVIIQAAVARKPIPIYGLAPCARSCGSALARIDARRNRRNLQYRRQK
jgi:dTDP-glucose 4,6-dehydratase